MRLSLIVFRASKYSTFVKEYSGHADKMLTIFLSKNVEYIPIPDEKELVITATNQFAAHVGLDWADRGGHKSPPVFVVIVVAGWIQICLSHDKSFKSLLAKRGACQKL